MIRQFAAAILFAFSSLFFSSPALAQAMIEADRSVHDFGTIERGADARASFEIRNSGTAPLVITHTRQSSRRAVVTLPRDPIMPGQAGSVTIRQDTLRPGTFSSTVTVYSNAMNNRGMPLRVKGIVR